MLDEKLRRRYDFFGLDVEEGTDLAPGGGETTDEAGNEQTIFSESTAQVTAKIAELALQITFVGVYFFCIQYFWLLVALTAGLTLLGLGDIYRAHKDGSSLKDSKWVVFGIVLLAWFLRWMSPASWFFLFGEAWVQWCTLNTLLPEEVTLVAVKAGSAVFFFFTAWYSGGAVMFYAKMIGLCAVAALGVIMFFQFSEMLVTAAVDLKLAKVGGKVRELLTKAERENEELRKRLRSTRS